MAVSQSCDMHASHSQGAALLLPAHGAHVAPTAPCHPPPLSCSCGGEVLLLQRTSKNNFGTWGLPGGNADDTDADLLEVATREAQEEMGPQLPRFQVLESVLTKRGKRWVREELEWQRGVQSQRLHSLGSHSVVVVRTSRPAVARGDACARGGGLLCTRLHRAPPPLLNPPCLALPSAPCTGARSSTWSLWPASALRSGPRGART